MLKVIVISTNQEFAVFIPRLARIFQFFLGSGQWVQEVVPLKYCTTDSAKFTWYLFMR